MPYASRAPRISNLKGRVRLHDSMSTIVNISRTGVLVTATKEWMPGSSLPLTIDLDGGALSVTGTVVRSEIASPLVFDGVARRQFWVALWFVSPTKDAQRVLDAMCGPRRHRHGLRLGPIHLSGARYCPRCFSR